MDNIFENAKFGDKFRTRDVRMVLFIEQSAFSREWYWLAVQDNGTCKYFEDGMLNINSKADSLDIIGKWEDKDDTT